MNGFATTDELSTKDGESWICRGTVLSHTCVYDMCHIGAVLSLNLLSYLNSRPDPERGAAGSVEPHQQDCRCPCLLANAAPQHPGGAQVKTGLPPPPPSPRPTCVCSTADCSVWNVVLRVQVSSECETPDSYVPSSSPESVADMEVSRFPDFSSVKLEPLSPCPSPPLPVLPSARGKGPFPIGRRLTASLWCRCQVF